MRIEINLSYFVLKCLPIRAIGRKEPKNGLCNYVQEVKGWYKRNKEGNRNKDSTLYFNPCYTLDA